jgi:phosphate-selective porin OprO/OprP
MWQGWTVRFGALGVAAAFCAGPEAQAQQLLLPQPSVEERLERLEKANEALLKQNQALQAEIQNLKVRGEETPVATGVDKEQVQGIVSQYLQQQADKAKAEKKEEWHVVGSDTKMNGFWKSGLQLETASGDFKVHVGGRYHQVWDWFNEDQTLKDAKNIGDLPDSFYNRRARLRVDGSAYEIFDWVAEFEFANASPTVPRELYFNIGQLPVIGNFRAGILIEPMGFDTVSSDRYITFVERSVLHNMFFPEYNPGMMIWNNTENLRLGWQLSFSREDVGDQGFDFNDGEYAYTSRVHALPWYLHDGRCLLHVAASYRHLNAQFDSGVGDHVIQYRGRPSFRIAPVGATPFFVDTGKVVSDGSDVVAGEIFLVQGPFALQSEIAMATINDAVVGSANVGNATLWGGYIQATYFLTGEHKGYDRKLGRLDRIKVNEPFFWVRTDEGTSRGRGAWELAARYTYGDLNDSGINGGLFNELALGINWYWNPNFKVMANYINTTRHGVPLASGRGNVDAALLVFAMDF